ncbi:MAG: hypothetical protein Kow001_21680 [Acidobacteriota bacterium]
MAGLLVLLHLAGGLILPYVLLNSVTAPPGFLENAAPHAAIVRASVVLFLVAAAVTLGISVAVFPILQPDCPRLALACLALGIANLPLQVFESASLLSMLSLSQKYAAAPPADTATLEVIAGAVGSARIWAHFTQLLTVVCWISLLYAALWRASRIPSWLGFAGLVTCALQIYGVPLRALLGYSAITWMAVPLAPAYLGLALWWIIQGLDGGRSRPAQNQRTAL